MVGLSIKRDEMTKPSSFRKRKVHSHLFLSPIQAPYQVSAADKIVERGGWA
jgi:hypothetical protein